MVSFLINTVCALSITIADVFLIIDSDRGILPSVGEVPMWLKAPAWSLWEFFTGFLLGLGIMLILVCLPKKCIAEEPFESALTIKNRKLHYFWTAGLLMTYSMCLTVMRPLGMRIGTHLFEAGLFEDEDTIGTIIAVVLTVIAGVICFVLQKSLLKEEKMPFSLTPGEFAKKAALFYFLATGVVYFFTDDELPFEGIRSMADFTEKWNAGGLTVLLLSLIAFALFLIFFTLTMKNSEKQANK